MAGQEVETPECLDRRDGNCRGSIEYRYPLSGTGKSFPRCDAHWEERLEQHEQTQRRYPDSPFAPEGFDPAYAGEHWDSDY